MSRWRMGVVLALMAVPLLFFMGLGSFRLWQMGLGVYVWWPLSGCVALGYFLAWYWMRKKQLLPRVNFDIPMHWSDRDREAYKLVEVRAKAVAENDPGQFQDLQFYVTQAQEMSLELARFYRPDAADPVSSRTVPEILAVVELASHDLAELVEKNVPGSHLLSIKDWRWAQETAVKATGWYRNASNLWWLASAVLSPVDTGLRYAASQAGMSQPFKLFQQDLIAWFHTAFVQRLGTYLIDLNSGRLRVGAHRFRELTRIQAPDGTAASVTGPVAEALSHVTLTVMGQVKMGKSSFVNALLGAQRARADVLPATSETTRYELQLPNVPTKLAVLDTVGYAHTGPKEDNLRATREAAQQSDLLILVLHARSPGRQADLEMLQKLREWYAAHPDLRMPPIVAVLSHVDLLSPAMEWAPPYDFQHPKRTKEMQMHEALLAVYEQLGVYLVTAVPVCTAEGKVWGIDEWFLPALMKQLGEAKGVALLRCLHAEADADKVRKVFDQLLSIGSQALRVWAQGTQVKR
ncbi:MAG: 50S ribosome-binding GTPase [Gemmataceae bacterium]|nr:50S ribosome-binding GTPase [Gemmataceae bacterium]